MSEPERPWHPIVMDLAIGLIAKDESGVFQWSGEAEQAIAVELDAQQGDSYISAIRDLAAFAAYLKAQQSPGASDAILQLLTSSVQRREEGHRQTAFEQTAAMRNDAGRLAAVVGTQEMKPDLLKPVPKDAVKPSKFHIPRRA